MLRVKTAFPNAGTGRLQGSIVARNRSREPWTFLRGAGRHSAIYRYRQTCFPVYITAVWTRQTTTYWWLLGCGAFCSRRAIVLLYWHTTLSRTIVTVFNNEERERESRAFCSSFSRDKKQTFSLRANLRLLGCRLCRCRLVSLYTRINSNCDFTKKRQANREQRSNVFHRGDNTSTTVRSSGVSCAFVCIPVPLLLFRMLLLLMLLRKAGAETSFL